MTEEKMNEIEELLDESLDIFADKKKFTKTMNSIIKDCSKKTGIEKSVLKKVKDYHHCKGVNWVNGNPLEKNVEVKEKDKIALVFIKLKEIVDNLRAVGDVKFLNEYLTAMDSCGIHITVDSSINSEEQIVNSDEIMEVIENASRLQTNVDTLGEELKENKSVEAEKLNFTPKSSFCNVLGILDKIREGKDVDDKIQDRFTELEMLNGAFTYLSKVNYKTNIEET